MLNILTVFFHFFQKYKVSKLFQKVTNEMIFVEFVGSAFCARIIVDGNWRIFTRSMRSLIWGRPHRKNYHRWIRSHIKYTPTLHSKFEVGRVFSSWLNVKACEGSASSATIDCTSSSFIEAWLCPKMGRNWQLVSHWIASTQRHQWDTHGEEKQTKVFHVPRARSRALVNFHR